VHSSGYLEKLKTACENGNYWFGYEDTYINKFSYEIALLSVGGCIEGVRIVLQDEHDRAFCSVRPPGHHAGRDQGMGFCLLNNISIAARIAQKEFGAGKIMIIDWDVHHGNGTQNIFEEDPSVFYVSIHEHPTFIFPGTGRRWEKGSGPGSGYTMNIPLPPGAGDSEYIQSMESLVVPAIKSFAPDLILISAGFDAHKEDPLSDMVVTEEGFRRITALTLKASADYSTGKVVSMLEGGYNLEAMKESVRIHLEEMIFS
jgi:acetoin utilization deacetylase AcuC-like enzyme